MRILCVAEKPSIAKAIANALGGGAVSYRRGGTKFNGNYDITHNFSNSWGSCQVVVTSVSGHLTELEFPPPFNEWGHDAGALFHAPIQIKYTESGEKVAKNIKNEAYGKDILYIWTDNDREGEFIGHCVAIEAKKANPRIDVKRAIFNNVEVNHLKSAASRPSVLNMNQVRSVEARRELDLRTGFSMTRLQGDIKGRYQLSTTPSYGSCQFPTMSFVVERYYRVKRFQPEKFWKIDLAIKKAGEKVNFNWGRTRLFDHPMALVLYERMLKVGGDATVLSKTSKPSRKYKPLPLTTVTLQKLGTKYLKMTSANIMTHAEKLYQKGFLSYPRTETDVYDPAINLRELVKKHETGPFSSYAGDLLNGKFESPRAGKHNDKAHPPIHPVSRPEASALSSDGERKVYEFVVRHFLACCSADAKGEQTTVNVEYGKEKFHATGLVVLERNYLDIFIYENWKSVKIPNFDQGERLEIMSVLLKEGLTNAPKHMTEPELVALMDANRIGTDATMADHIQKVKDREYILSEKGLLIPTVLGCALYNAYEALNLHKSVTKPQLRQETEYELNLLAKGEVPKDSTMTRLITDHERIYKATKAEKAKWIAEVDKLMK